MEAPELHTYPHQSVDCLDLVQVLFGPPQAAMVPLHPEDTVSQTSPQISGSHNVSVPVLAKFSMVPCLVSAMGPRRRPSESLGLFPYLCNELDDIGLSVFQTILPSPYIILKSLLKEGFFYSLKEEVELAYFQYTSKSVTLALCTY